MITGTLILIFVPAAKRGNAEQLGAQLKARTSWLRDMRALIRNRSYVFSSLATSAVSFATGALGMWIPLYLHRAQISDVIQQSTKESPLWEFLSLGYALMLCPFVVVLGGMFFLATALFFLSDRAKAEQQ
ncbi:hypothetical protein EYD10_09398 [Varanus komodoensis]|nr:hypothetical protein EYD10_09398 [Varanus komodoensis]